METLTKLAQTIEALAGEHGYPALLQAVADAMRAEAMALTDEDSTYEVLDCGAADVEALAERLEEAEEFGTKGLDS